MILLLTLIFVATHSSRDQHGTCDTWEWQCANGDCIDGELFCNGHPDHGNDSFGSDCSDDSDEILQVCCDALAADYGEVCSNEAVRYQAVGWCDSDLNDEQWDGTVAEIGDKNAKECWDTCKAAHPTATNLVTDFLNDGESTFCYCNDCDATRHCMRQYGSTDSYAPPGFVFPTCKTCEDDEWKCADGEQCIDASELCDASHYHCSDGSDEMLKTCCVEKPVTYANACRNLACSAHSDCSNAERPFCSEGYCSPCSECHTCDNGIDGTCGTCGEGFPTQEAGPCLNNNNGGTGGDGEGNGAGSGDNGQESGTGGDDEGNGAGSGDNGQESGDLTCSSACKTFIADPANKAGYCGDEDVRTSETCSVFDQLSCLQEVADLCAASSSITILLAIAAALLAL